MQLVVMVLGAVPIVGMFTFAAVKILGPIGQAIGRRLGGGSSSGEVVDRRLELMADDLDHLRAQLVETQERLEFAERLLATRQHEQLPGGPH